ncbi:unnamed protein product [Caenorhabditis auriculariae]|uniref:Uncharacterized protein n=1 Tax=Caenorhabditis auriculariae TaxID=2777116 RepID=A0A8S1HW08_9PELO|nr:unnamed protein product [Caenorhabditis auriculariae]
MSVAHFIEFSACIIFNVFAIFVYIFKSVPEIGNYKYLVISYSLAQSCYSSFIGSFVGFINFHFFYRYVIVCSKTLHGWLRGWRLALVSLSIVFTQFLWWISSLVSFYPTDYLDRQNEDLYFRIFQRPIAKQAYFASTLLQQLFIALVFQALLPTFFVNFPMALIFGFSFVNIEFSWAVYCAPFLFNIYPAIDPLLNILIIKDYRRGSYEILRNMNCKRRRSNRY